MQDHLDKVRAAINDAKKAGQPYAMLIIDPITSYLHGSKLRKVDMNDSGQLRTILEPWTRLAKETGIAIVAVTHLAKDTTPARSCIACSAVARSRTCAAA